MKSFLQYLEESVKENFYAIKFSQKPTDEQVKKLEKHLIEHGLTGISDLADVVFDKVDFWENPKRDIWQINFTTSKPISPYMLVQELKVALNIPEDGIIVRASNEPYELEADDCEFECEADLEAKEKDLVAASRLSTDRFYNDEEQPMLTDVFGNNYNKRLLDYLRNVADNRKTVHYEAPAPLFSWLEMNKVMDKEAVDSEDFNAEFDTPKPVGHGKGAEEPPVKPVYLGHEGNFDDASVRKIKLLKTKEGKREAVSAPRSRLKAE